jgi:ubiquitin carboxyl-terminal hydrolase 26/29/37
MVKKDVGCPETKKDLLRKVKSAISATAERFSGYMQNVRTLPGLIPSSNTQL